MRPKSAMREERRNLVKGGPFYPDVGLRIIKRKKRKVPLEKVPERKTSATMREQKALVCKLAMLGQNSWPDRLVIPEGVKVTVYVCRTEAEANLIFNTEMAKPPGRRELFMIEWKRDDGSEPTELQAALHKQLRSGNHG